MTPKEKIAAAKSVPIGDLLYAISGQPRISGKDIFYTCPFHKDETPSMHVILSSNRCYCFSCQRSMDTIALTQEYHNFSFQEAVEYLVGSTYSPAPLPIPMSEKEDLAQNWYEKYLCPEFVEKTNSQLAQNKQALDYILSRGITLETANRAKIGVDGTGLKTRITIPYISPRVENIKISAITRRRLINKEDEIPESLFASTLEEVIRERNIAISDIEKLYDKIRVWVLDKILGPKYLRWGSAKEIYNTPLFYVVENGVYIMNGDRPIRRALPHVIVVEGEFDALILLQAGFNAVAWKANSNQDSLGKIFASPFVGRVLIIQDNDEAGEKYAENAWASIKQYGKTCSIISPKEGKDVTDWWMSNSISLVDTLEQNGAFL